MRHVYFPGLDILRFYAALSVVIWHSNARLGLPLASTGWLSGWDAVTLFFVLSGFLITYLLLKERNNTGRIDVRAFYLRRTLRIWPLYYLVVFIAFVVMRGNARSLGDLLAILLLLPYFAARPPGLGHLWSIGIEEMYYLLYPLLVRRFKVVNICWWILALRWSLLIIVTLAPYSGVYAFQGLHRFLVWSRLDAMAIGGLFAWLVYRQHPWLKIMYRAFPVATAVAVVAVLFPASDYGNSLYDTLFAIVCGALIVNVIRLPALDSKWARAAGNISYGIYMYHMPILYMLPVGLVATGIAVPLTIAVAVLSYGLIEKPFLQLKGRYQPKPAFTPAVAFGGVE